MTQNFDMILIDWILVSKSISWIEKFDFFLSTFMAKLLHVLRVELRYFMKILFIYDRCTHWKIILVYIRWTILYHKCFDVKLWSMKSLTDAHFVFRAFVFVEIQML